MRTPLLDTVLGFVGELRAHGLAISPPEVADAGRALAAVPEVIGERELFEAVLAGTLVKRLGDLAVFREVFAAYFLPEVRSEYRHGHEHEHHEPGQNGFAGVDVLPRPGVMADGGEERHEHGRRIDLRRFFGEGAETSGHDHHAGDRWRLTWLSRQRVFDQARALSEAGGVGDGALGLRRVATEGQPGALRPGSGIELPRDVVLKGNASPGGEWNGDRLDEEAIARIRRKMAAASVPGSSSDRESSIEREVDPANLKWRALTAADLRRLESAVARMGRRFGGAPGQRGTARWGRLDGPRTARAAARTDGLPFAPVYRSRRDDRPRLVVLCDVSLSVRGAARFLLQVARAAQRGNGRVRTFVFVREVAEATRCLAEDDLETAIGMIFGGHLLDTAEASDAGAAFWAFLKRHGSMLSAKTTVLILGDGRNNGRDPGIEALAAIRDRCRRVVWLTPEDRGTWRLAGCDLPRYAAWCDVIAPARTPAELERFVAARQW